jgi:hypothetical protein
MTLDDLATIRPFANPLAVPEWTLGCWRRRCITFANGEEDTTTQVIWVQSHDLTGDIRAPKVRPPLIGKAHLGDCTDAELACLARAEGFVAQTSWRDGLMSWDAFAAFQPYDRWPEPGRLERVGACLIEWAPSGVYVEDWRLQPGSSGLSVGLRLVSETRLNGEERPREGGLVIAGDHALMVLGRRAFSPPGRAWELIATAEDPLQMASIAFDCQVSYALRQDARYVVALSIDPFANGLPLFMEDGFEMGEAADELIQRPGPGELWNLRRWKIQTLLPNQKRPRATPTTENGGAWFEAERSSLIHS